LELTTLVQKIVPEKTFVKIICEEKIIKTVNKRSK